MKSLKLSICTILTAAFAGAAVAAAPLEAPKGALVRRNVDLAAAKAFDAWVAQLQAAPHTEGIVTIGILPLGGDPAGFTQILEAKLTALDRFRIVILSGPEWNAIEDEVARQDPDEGFGDIMDKAYSVWTNLPGDEYQISETTKGAQAILFGKFRDVDADWLRARTRFTLKLGTVGTRELVAGGLVEGESILTVRDLLVYYKIELAVLALALVALGLVLKMLKSLGAKMTRPR